MKYMKQLIIVIIVSILVFFLKWLNVLQVENGFGTLPVMAILILVISSIVILIQNRIDLNHRNDDINYSNLDLLRYIASILIIILHFRPFINTSDQLDLAFNNILTRICVPIFFVITGFFVAKKEKENDHYIDDYIKKTIPLYISWNIIYLPLLIMTIISNMPLISTYINSINIPLPIILILAIALLPLLIIIGLVYTGLYYHLWYFPALILSLIVLKKWKKKFKLQYLLIIAFFLLLFGATETYYGILPIGLKNLIQYYYKICFTTRNFLFFGLFYVVLGYVMGTKKDLYTTNCFLKLITSIFFLIFEGIFLHDIERLNSNILIFCIPIVYYLFISIIYIDCKKKSDKWRLLSKYYYLLHPLVLFFFLPLLNMKNELDYCFELLLIVILLTHALTLFVIKLKNRYVKLVI